MKTYTEKIECPNCGDIQDATVEHTKPFYSYVHYCTECEYMIGESEWNVHKEFLPNFATTNPNATMAQKTEQEVIDFLNSESYQIELIFAEPERLANKLLELFYGEAEKEQE